MIFYTYTHIHTYMTKSQKRLLASWKRGEEIGLFDELKKIDKKLKKSK